VKSLFRFIVATLLGIATTAHAGTACRKLVVTPEDLAHAAEAAVATYAELEKHDAPVALVARVGTDLSKYGLKYSHVAFAVRDHADGRWSVVHLLNHCGTDRSSLYAEGLVNFYLDDLVSLDTKIVWLQPDAAERVVKELQSPAIESLHHSYYSVIARPDSPDYQNSTDWVLDVLIDALDDKSGTHRRADVQRAQTRLGFQPDILQISYAKRIAGGLFAANAAFTDHPIATRLSGKYPLVTVRSIFRLAREQHWAAEELAMGPHKSDSHD
jgi:hypothetical protein